MLVRWRYCGLVYDPHAARRAAAASSSSSAAATAAAAPAPASDESEAEAEVARRAGAGPPGYFEFKGFPSVYIGVRDDVLGKIRDLRAPVSAAAPRPSKDYVMTLPSAELKAMWRRGLVAQRAALVEAEGEGSALARALQDELKTVDAFDAAAADREWARKLPPPKPAAAAASSSSAAAAAAAAAAH